MKTLVVLALVALVAAKTRYDNYQVWEVTPKTITQVNAAHLMTEDTQLDLWKDHFAVGKSVEVLVPPHKVEELKLFLGKNNIEYVVAEENFQTVLDEEDARLAEKKAFDLNDWNTYSEIMDQMDVWASQCPSGSTCAVNVIGQSIEGRDIKALSIEGGSGRRGIWIDSLIHSREWLAGSTLLNFMERLVNGNDAEATYLRDNYNLYLGPVSNPDGYLYTFSNDRLWRKNRVNNAGSVCMGVDLNRNFDAEWASTGGSSDNPCTQTYRGPSAASEPETQAIAAALDQWDIDVFVHIHAYGNMWLHPWGYSDNLGRCVLSADHDDQYDVATATAQATMAVYGTTWTWGNICQTIYAASGSAADYAYTVGTKYAVSPEVRGSSFTPPPSQIPPAYEETWAGLVALVNRAAEIEGW